MARFWGILMDGNDIPGKILYGELLEGKRSKPRYIDICKSFRIYIYIFKSYQSGFGKIGERPIFSESGCA